MAILLLGSTSAAAAELAITTPAACALADELTFRTERALGRSIEVTIENNAGLRSIDFSDIIAIDFLSIANNPALDSVALGDLSRVDELEVSGNAALDLGVFDAVQTFSSKLSVAPAGAP